MITEPKFVLIDKRKYDRFIQLKKIKEQSQTIILSDNAENTKTGKFLRKLQKRKPEEERLVNISEPIPRGIDKYIDKKSGQIL